MESILGIVRQALHLPKYVRTRHPEQFRTLHRSSCLVRLALLIGWAALAVVGILACSAISEQFARARDRERYLPTGQQIEVNGSSWHLYCSGQGSPTVVLEAGIGSWSIHWSKVQARVEEFTRVCSYDRAGYGWSERSSLPRTSQQQAAELYALLEKAGETGPFVLVGFAEGGYPVRVFAGEYPDAVAGVVLVDAEQEDFPTQAVQADRQFEARLDRDYGFLRLAADSGWLRIWNAPDPNGLPGLLRDQSAQLAPTQKAEYMAQYLPGIQVALKERLALPESRAQARAAQGLGSLPLAVLVRGMPANLPPDGDPGALEAAWLASQQQLAGLSTQGSLLIVAESGHFIPLVRPCIVAEQVELIVRKVQR